MKLAFCVLVALAACSSPVESTTEEVTVDQTVDSAAFYFELIDQGNASSEDLDKARKHFIAEDSLIVSDPKKLMQAGLVLMSGERDFLYGVNYLITLTKKYPTHDYAPEALMQLALFFENRLSDQEQSSLYLKSLIDRYPNHELAAQAKSLIALGSGNELNTIQNWLNKD